MSFSFLYLLYIPFTLGKEYMDFSKTHHDRNKNLMKKLSLITMKRTPVSASLKGSVTVEASVIIPVFFMALVCILSLFEMQATRLTVRNGLQCAGQNIADMDYESEIFAPLAVGAKTVEAIGADRLDRSFVVGGSSGISCRKSYRDPVSHEYTFWAEYKVRLPFSVFGVPPVKQKVRLHMKGWSGYTVSGSTTDDVIVYITATGEVYHRNSHCSYLDLTIHTSTLEHIETERNRYQERYRACEYCGYAATGTVYITDMGNRYHSNIRCTGLKRQVRAVRLSQVGKRRPCSRCGY